MNQTDFFISQTLSQVRTLPLGNATAFLGGLLILADDDSGRLVKIRASFRVLQECDRKLERIAAGRLTSPFPIATRRKSRRS